MRVGLIGAGNIARYAHLPGYEKTAGVQIAAICDIVPERAREMAAKYSIPAVFTDYRKMLELKLDAVSICAPNHLHAETAIAALQSGAHVLCEKPMATSAAEADKMVAAARAAGKYLMMGFNNRFRADARALKAQVSGGQFGEIYYARCGWVRRRGIPAWGSWFTRKQMAGGGALIDIGVHALDLTVWLMGKPEPVAVMGATYNKFGGDPERGAGAWGARQEGYFDVDDLACAMIRFANGAALLLEASWASHIERDQMYVQLLGSEAGAQFGTSPAQARVFSTRGGVAQDTTLVLPDSQSLSPYAAEIAEFAACIEQKRVPESSGEDGARIMRILDAIYTSAETGASVAIR